MRAVSHQSRVLSCYRSARLPVAARPLGFDFAVGWARRSSYDQPFEQQRESGERQCGKESVEHIDPSSIAYHSEAGTRKAKKRDRVGERVARSPQSAVMAIEDGVPAYEWRTLECTFHQAPHRVGPSSHFDEARSV